MPIDRSRNMFAASLIALAGLACAAHADEQCQPNASQKLHASAPSMSPTELSSSFSNAIVVDLRSKAEFEVMRISNAVNLPFAQFNRESLSKLRGASADKPLVFVSNTPASGQSASAAAQALSWGFSNVFAFSGELQAWASAQSSKSEFFGKPLASQSDKLIPQAKFEAALTSPANAVQLAEQGYKVFDIRDQADRKDFKIEVGKVNRMNVNDFVSLLAQNKSIPQSKFVIIDNDGGTARWVQYYLEQAGRSDYFFVRDGVTGWKSAGLNGTGTPQQTADAVSAGDQ